MVAKLCIALAYAFWHCTLGHKVEVIQIPRSFSQSVMGRVVQICDGIGCGNYMRYNWYMLTLNQSNQSVVHLTNEFQSVCGHMDICIHSAAVHHILQA